MSDQSGTGGAPRLEPFQPLTLSQADREKLIKHINAKWAHKTCPFCGENNWDPGGWAPIVLGKGPASVVIGGPVLPAAAIVCLNCGFTVFINAMVAGVDPRAYP